MSSDLRSSKSATSEGGLSIHTELSTHVSLCETVIILLFNTINAIRVVSLLTFGSHPSTS